VARSRTRLLLIAALLAAALACNMPRLVIPEPTRTPAPTLPASPTIPPLPVKNPPTPTSAPSPAPPTPTFAPPPATAAPPTEAAAVTLTLPPSPTVIPPTPTAGYPVPDDRALFEGAFTGGKLTFRIGANSQTVIPKSLTLKGAACKEGGKVSTSLTFEPPPEYPISQGRFTISYDGVVTIFGQFQSAERVLGTVSVKIIQSGGNCTFGPVPWAATSFP
jgi:hypothetical protein